MLSIIVVDDEERIRLGLAKLIEQAGEDYQVIGIFESGNELLENLERMEPDLIITDIKMPQMSGLTLIERIKELRPNVPIAIVSGFSDFEYARQAIRLGVEEYLLKPVETEELTGLLERVRTKLIHERSRQITAKDDYLRLLAINEPGKLPAALKEEADAALHEHPLFSDYYATLVLRASVDRVQSRIRSWAQDLQRETRVLSWRLGELVILVAIHPGDDAETVRSLGASLLSLLPANVHVRAGASGIFYDPLSLNESYKQAMSALEYTWYEEGIRAFEASERIAKRIEDTGTLHRLIDRDFRSALHTVDYERAETALRAWMQEAGRIHLQWHTLMEHGSLLQTLIREEKADRNLLAEGDEILDPLLPMNYPEWSEFTRALLHLVQEQFRLLKDMQQDNRVIETVKSYIFDHYIEELELNRLAEIVYLTPSYLSKLFKMKTGETITDLIISLRIDEAKRLLVSELALKTYEVGERVGYSDPAYFNKVFKKVVGITPKEYRDRVRI
ncbi:response regulator transcription factor [Gorillibacterium timonense]|uniref:response regulator transcription factor n=1 Tax=Gorillibacterium timonense TaxID=1689269 RepID=UPI00071D8942|nr:response regulator [Gorillibacterium timonense]